MDLKQVIKHGHGKLQNRMYNIHPISSVTPTVIYFCALKCCADRQNRDQQPTTSYELKHLWRNHVRLEIHVTGCRASRDFLGFPGRMRGNLCYRFKAKYNMPDEFAGSQHFALIKTFFNPTCFFLSLLAGTGWFMVWWCHKGKMGDYFWQLHPPKLAAPSFPGNQNLLIWWMKLHSAGS